jgi:hypothetical protein
MIVRGVMLYGNLLTGEPMRPVWRLECPDCTVIVAVNMDDLVGGWDLWRLQNEKDTDTEANDIPF